MSKIIRKCDKVKKIIKFIIVLFVSIIFLLDLVKVCYADGNTPKDDSDKSDVRPADVMIVVIV